MDRINKIVEEYQTNLNFNGVILLKKGEETLFKKEVGYASRRFLIPNRIDYSYDTASITKLFTTVGILQLIEKGLCNFDSKVMDILPLANVAFSRDITILQLLNHTSGIHDDCEEEAGENYGQLFVSRPNYSYQSNSDHLEDFIHKTPNFLPGTKMRYCNCSYILLGMVIEYLSGMRYRDYIETFVFEKAKMSHSGFFRMDGVEVNVAEGYKSLYDDMGNRTGYLRNIYSFPPIGTAEGGSYVSAIDLNHFIDCIMDGTFFSKEMGEQMMHPKCNLKEKAFWLTNPNLFKTNGCGFEFILKQEEVFRCFKEGQNDGVSNVVSYYPKEDIRLIILGNTDCNVWRLSEEIEKVLVELYSL